MTHQQFHALLSTATPVPTRIGESVDRAVDGAVNGANRGWEFLIGTPLRIAIVIVVAVALTFVLRLVIRSFTRKIADGTVATRARNRDGESRLLRLDPVAVARRAQRARTVGSLLSSLAAIIVAIIAVLMIMQELGFNPAPILASAGVAGVAIGFGAQSLVRDYLSGFFIVVEDQYGIGDTVDIGEAIGEVEEVSLRTTRIRGIDGTLWHVPNGQIQRVGNQSQGWARAVMDIPVPYDADQAKVEDAIQQAVATLRSNTNYADAILEDPEIWGVQEISGNAVTIRTVIKTQPNEQWAIARAFRSEIRAELRKHGISIAIPEQSIISTMPDPKTTHHTATIEEDTHAPESTANGTAKNTSEKTPEKRDTP